MVENIIMPAISVLLPFYNARDYLKLSIESVLEQTYKDFELILINDGSSDDSLAIAESFADHRIRIINSPLNKGIVASLNIGLEQANGHYIARMDADDLCSPMRFEKQIEFLERHLEIGIVGCSAQLIDGQGNKIGFHRMPISSLEVRWNSMFICPFLHSSILMRKVILEKNSLKYDAFYYPAEDYELWGRFLEVSEGANLPEMLINYRTHHKSISSLNKNRQIEKHLIISNRIIRKNSNYLQMSDDRQYQLLIAVGHLDSSEVGYLSRAELAQDYLTIWESFADRYSDHPELRLVKERVIAKAARMILYPPVQKGMKYGIKKIQQIQTSWIIPFLKFFPSKLIEHMVSKRFIKW